MDSINANFIKRATPKVFVEEGKASDGEKRLVLENEKMGVRTLKESDIDNSIDEANDKKNELLARKNKTKLNLVDENKKSIQSQMAMLEERKNKLQSELDELDKNEKADLLKFEHDQNVDKEILEIEEYMTKLNEFKAMLNDSANGGDIKDGGDIKGQI